MKEDHEKGSCSAARHHGEPDDCSDSVSTCAPCRSYTGVAWFVRDAHSVGLAERDLLDHGELQVWTVASAGARRKADLGRACLVDVEGRHEHHAWTLGNRRLVWLCRDVEHLVRRPLMGWRFQKRKKLMPGVTLNVGKRSGGLSFGPRGAKVSASNRGVGASLSLLGTGLAYVWRKRR